MSLLSDVNCAIQFLRVLQIKLEDKIAPRIIEFLPNSTNDNVQSLAPLVATLPTYSPPVSHRPLSNSFLSETNSNEFTLNGSAGALFGVGSEVVARKAVVASYHQTRKVNDGSWERSRGSNEKVHKNNSPSENILQSSKTTNLQQTGANDSSAAVVPLQPYEDVSEIIPQSTSDYFTEQQLTVELLDAFSSNTSSAFKHEKPPELLQIAATKSNLSNRLKLLKMESNPFMEHFSKYSGKGELESNSLSFKIWCTFSVKSSKERPMDVSLKRNVTVQEAIGFILFQYFDEKRQPALPIVSQPGLDLQTLLNFIQAYSLRITEDDECIIDSDFPPLDRNSKLCKYSFEYLALVVEAKKLPPNQQQQSQQSSSYRNPNLVKLSSESGSHSSMIPNSSSTTAFENGRSSRMQQEGSTTPSNPNSNGNNPFFIKINVYSTLEVKQTTTVSVTNTTKISAVHESVCKKRKLEPSDYSLRFSDMKTEVPLDKSVIEIGDRIGNLYLLRKERGDSAGDIFLRPPAEAESGSLRYSPLSEESPVSTSTLSLMNNPSEIASVYKKYVVTLKKRTGVVFGFAQGSSNERELVLDGEYVHIVAPNDSKKNISFHISQVISCTLVEGSKGAAQNGPSLFRLIIADDPKPYDFESASAKEASKKKEYFVICNFPYNRRHFSKNFISKTNRNEIYKFTFNKKTI